MTGRALNYRLWMVAAVLIAVVAYTPALKSPFFFDTAEAINDNPSIRRLWPLSVPLNPAERTAVAGRPAVNLTLAINYAINRALHIPQSPDTLGNPAESVGYHVANVVLHIICGLLIWGVLRRTIRSQQYSPRWAANAEGIATAIAAIWLVHPLQSEAVNYVIQRTEIVVSMCYAGMMYSWIRAWEATTARRRTGWRIVAVAAAIVGMASKEVMISAPLMLALYDRAFRVDSWRDVFGIRALWYVAVAATSVVLLQPLLSGARGVTVGTTDQFPWYLYLYSQGWAIPRYVRLLFWPNGLAIDYGYNPVRSLAAVPGLILLGAAFIGTLWAWLKVDRWGWLAFTGAWFFLLLGPSSSFVPILTEIAAERRIYLAVVAVLVVVAALIDLAWQRARASLSKPITGRSGWLAPATFAALLLSLGATTFARSMTYKSAESIWRDAIAKLPENPRAYEGLGAAIEIEDSTRAMESTKYFLRARELDSTFDMPWLQLARLAHAQGHYDEEGALLAHGAAIQPGSYALMGALGQYEEARKNWAAAAMYYDRAVQLQPSYAVLNALGRCYRRAGKLPEAKLAYQQATDLFPDSPDGYIQVSTIAMDMGQWDEAIGILNRTVNQFPMSALATVMLGAAYGQVGRPAEAVRFARHGSELAENNPTILGIAGHAFLVAGDGHDAEVVLARAAQLNPNDPGVMTDLVEAELLLGRRDRAAELLKAVLSRWPGFPPAMAAMRRIATAPPNH